MDPGPAGLDPFRGGIAVLACLAGVAFFASAEAALLALNKGRMRGLAEDGDARAQLIAKLIQRRERLVGALILAENTLIVAASAILTYILSRALHWPGHLELLASVGAGALVVVLLGELIPRSYGAGSADRYALFIARPLAWTVRALAAPVWLLTSVTQVYVHVMNLAFRGQQELRLPLLTDAEMRTLLEEVQEQGRLEQDETDMIRSVIQLRETVAREIMTPRIDVVGIPEGASFDEALQLALDEGHSRLPVYRGSLDHIVGTVHVKDLLAFLGRDRVKPEALPAEVLRLPYHVPESKRVDELLASMRTEKVHLAIVLDEFGGTAGLVTIEDILEEIVGDIQDEHDEEEPPAIAHQPDGSLLVDGLTHLEDLAEPLGARLDTEDYDTLGGFVVGLLGRPPREGEAVVHEGIRMEVVEVEARRASRIRVWRRNTAPLVQDLANADAEALVAFTHPSPAAEPRRPG